VQKKKITSQAGFAKITYYQTITGKTYIIAQNNIFSVALSPIPIVQSSSHSCSCTGYIFLYSFERRFADPRILQRFADSYRKRPYHNVRC